MSLLETVPEKKPSAEERRQKIKLKVLNNEVNRLNKFRLADNLLEQKAHTQPQGSCLV
jgi:hypothetical protein